MFRTGSIHPEMSNFVQDQGSEDFNRMNIVTNFEELISEPDT